VAILDLERFVGFSPAHHFFSLRLPSILFPRSHGKSSARTADSLFLVFVSDLSFLSRSTTDLGACLLEGEETHPRTP